MASTELARHFSDYLARVRYGSTTVIVMKNNSDVAELRPLAEPPCALGDFLELWKPGEPDPEFADQLEAVNRADQIPGNPWD